MNNEIKEKIKAYYVANDIDKIIDYITNLQEELQQEKKDFKEANDYCFELKDYKTRVDKAIEYNYELQERYCHSALYDEPVASKIYEISEKELNILQGSDKE